MQLVYKEDVYVLKFTLCILKSRVSLKPTDALLFTVILKQIKIILYAPTCFDPRWDHPQGVLSVLG
jgi:hypothetical protein